MHKRLISSLACGLLAAALIGCEHSSPGAQDDAALEKTAVAAYTYTYPLISEEITRLQAVNVAEPNARGDAPVNQFSHITTLPDASFKSVVRPNVDTLYSTLFFDVSEQPLVISVPDMRGRYHLFPILDAWTNVFAVPGTRTLGDRPGYRFAITGPNWSGNLPEGVISYKSPTSTGWVIGRVQVNGREDIANVAELDHGIAAVPLDKLGSDYSPPKGVTNPDVPHGQSVPAYIHSLKPQQYWDLYYRSASHAQTLPQDTQLLDQLAAARWSPKTTFDLAALPERERRIWEGAFAKALQQIEVPGPKGAAVNGWETQRSDIGSYGTNWLSRAIIAYSGIGANLPEDAIYPIATKDVSGAALRSDHSYTLRFPAGELPPANAFWSLTLYNEDFYFADNPINRYSLRGENLVKNPDGSVEIVIQRESPGAGAEANWLPTPASGGFNLLLRLYSPGKAAIDGSWNPPPTRAA